MCNFYVLTYDKYFDFHKYFPCRLKYCCTMDVYRVMQVLLLKNLRLVSTVVLKPKNCRQSFQIELNFHRIQMEQQTMHY